MWQKLSAAPLRALRKENNKPLGGDIPLAIFESNVIKKEGKVTYRNRQYYAERWAET
jgi:hypothetical protein